MRKLNRLLISVISVVFFLGNKTFAQDAIGQSPSSNNADYCSELPRPGMDDEIVILRIREGAAISTATVAGDLVVTETAEVNVLAGGKPLYIIALSRNPVIWRVSGETERVSHFVISSIYSTGGATGLEEPHVAISKFSQCIQSFMLPGDPFRKSTEALSTNFERKILGVAAQWKASLILVPTDLNQSLPTGLSASLRKPEVSWGPLVPNGDRISELFLKSYPGGVVDIDPKLVISSHKAKSYNVLPMLAGIIQLQQRGSLEFYPDYGGYLLKENISNLPAGLSTRYILHNGVTPPASDSHSFAKIITLQQAQDEARNLPAARYLDPQR